MIHLLSTIAETYRFDAEDFIKFHEKLGDKLTWFDETLGVRITNTWYADEAIRAYKVHIGVYNKSES